jgi:hypothetical protein
MKTKPDRMIHTAKETRIEREREKERDIQCTILEENFIAYTYWPQDFYTITQFYTMIVDCSSQ